MGGTVDVGEGVGVWTGVLDELEAGEATVHPASRKTRMTMGILRMILSMAQGSDKNLSGRIFVFAS